MQPTLLPLQLLVNTVVFVIDTPFGIETPPTPGNVVTINFRLCVPLLHVLSEVPFRYSNIVSRHDRSALAVGLNGVFSAQV